jgi:hypothetical protein
MRTRNLEVIAEHAVEPDLEAGDPGARALPGFELGNPALARVRELVEPVAHLVVSGAQDPSRVRDRRRLVDQRALQQLFQFRRTRQRVDHLGRGRAGQRAQPRNQIRQPRQRITQCPEIAGRRLGDRDPAGEPLQIGKAAHCVAERSAREAIGQPCSHRLLPCGETRGVPQRTLEPRAQTPRTERRDGEIQMMPERMRGFATRLGHEQLEVARGRRVIAERIVLAPALDPRRTQRGAALHAVEIRERRRCRGACSRQLVEQRTRLRPS